MSENQQSSETHQELDTAGGADELHTELDLSGVEPDPIALQHDGHGDDNASGGEA